MTKQQRRPRRANVRELSYNEQFKMDTARVLIQERHYDEALALLRTVDHPLARRWETRLGARRRRRNTLRRTTIALLALVALTLFVMAVVFGALFVRNQTSIDVEQGTVVAAVATFSRIAEDATGIVPTSEAELSALITAAAATSAALDVSVAEREADATIAVGDALATEAAVATQFARDVDATQFATLQSAEVTPGSPDNPIPAQSPISGAFESGELRLFSAQRPTGYVLYEDTRIIAPPADETILGLEIGFVCPAALDACPRVPSTSLVLADGQTINESLLTSPDAPGLFTDVDGGEAVSGWRFFRLPRTAVVVSVLVVDPSTSAWLYAALPAPIDGYTVETSWSEPSDGTSTRRLPAFRRELEARGYLLDETYLLEEGSQTYVRLYAPADAPLTAFALDAVAVWDTFRQLAPAGLRIEMARNDRRETLVIRSADMLAYNNGALDQAAFSARWQAETTTD